MTQSSVNDIVQGDHDSNHRLVVDVYTRQSDRYAVYQTEQRVIVAYADDPLVQKIQRKRLAVLAVLRSEIDGMLGPWREKSPSRSRLSGTARQFDMRVASALIEALEGEVETARAILERVKAEVAGEMASRARLAYVIWSLISAVAVAIAAVLVYFASGHFFKNELIPKADRLQLLAATETGVLGALYSIAMRIERRSLRNDQRRFDNITDSFVRLGLGAMGAFILGCFLVSGAIQISFGDIKPGAGGSSQPTFAYLVVIAGFLAGFVERLVPDLLNSYSITARPAEEAPSPQAWPAGQAANAAAASPAGASEEAVPNDEAEILNEPSDEEDVDGCDAHLDDAAEITPDEELPPSTGGVARQ